MHVLEEGVQGRDATVDPAPDLGVGLPRWETREELRLAIVIWIEKKYHRRRRQAALGRLTPIECETIYSAADAA